MKEFEIHFYENSRGKKPVEEFILSLDDKMRAKTLRTIKLLQTNGYNLREPYTKHINDGIFEIRTQQGNNISRVFYFFVIDNRIVLTNGFIKKTQKTPPNEIKLAEDYRKDYMSRFGKEL